MTSALTSRSRQASEFNAEPLLIGAERAVPAGMPRVTDGLSVLRRTGDTSQTAP
jgi:hypothetical protein